MSFLCLRLASKGFSLPYRYTFQRNFGIGKRVRQRRSDLINLKPIKVAIVGRPNVGKSTIFNRLVGRDQHKAIVSNVAGTTRDRREGVGQLGELEFTLTDTGGFEDVSKYEESFLASRHGPSLLEGMLDQTSTALKDADVVMMVIDAQQGVIPEDLAFARFIRKRADKEKILLLANKSENVDEIFDIERLGFGEAIRFSATHLYGLGDLYTQLEPFAISDSPHKESNDDMDVDNTVKVCILGRPNVGKSTLLNGLLGKERVLTGPTSGLTRDVIQDSYTYGDKNIKIFDTAGIRKRAKLYSQNVSAPRKGQNITASAKVSEASLEDVSITDSMRAMNYSQVVVFVLDVIAQKGEFIAENCWKS